MASESDCPLDELAARTVQREARLRRACGTWALGDERTLSVVVKLLDALFAQYQLNRMDERVGRADERLGRRAAARARARRARR